jgi:hypothetical protein
LGSGIASNVNANVPPAPTFTNPSNYYERLKLTLATGNNPSSTLYNIAISSDNFATTNYVQPDNTIGPSLGIANYQTHANWGGSNGFYVIGLQPNTTYKAKIRAYSGNYSGSAYSQTATASTVLPSVTFSVSTTLTATPPFNIAFESLVPGNFVYSSNYDPLVSLTTNALYGGYVFIKGQNNGLKSNSANYTINSNSTDLSSSANGYGAQVVSTSQTGGGPFTAISPYEGSGNNVGFVPDVLQPILATSSQITSANATIQIKAKTNIIVPSENDYADIITFIASMLF